MAAEIPVSIDPREVERPYSSLLSFKVASRYQLFGDPILVDGFLVISPVNQRGADLNPFLKFTCRADIPILREKVLDKEQGDKRNQVVDSRITNLNLKLSATNRSVYIGNKYRLFFDIKNSRPDRCRLKLESTDPIEITLINKDADFQKLLDPNFVPQV